MSVAARIALRELRGGLGRFRVLILCLALGVAAIAAVGSVRAAIEAGLDAEGAAILGGDAEATLTYRGPTGEELDWLNARSEALSAVVDFRSMAVVTRGDAVETALTQVKAVDAAYPLYGAVALDPPMPLSEALAGQGAVMDPVLIARLGLEVGDSFSLGMARFELRAALTRAPDNAGGFGFGPPTLVRTGALDGSGLIAPGTLYETKLRLRLAPQTDLAALETEAQTAFDGAGLRWRDRRNAAPGTQRIVTRIGAFLVLVGLAGLAVGGVGVSSAVRSYLDAKRPVIATLKSIGANARMIFTIYAIEIGLISALGIALGLILGMLLPLAAGALLADSLPVPALFGVYAAPLGEAALYGALTAALFALWPLGQAQKVRAAALYRIGPVGWPGRGTLGLIALGTIGLLGAAMLFSGAPLLAFWAAIGVSAAMLLLALAAALVRWCAARGARAARGAPVLRLALGAIGARGGDTRPVMLALGLGLAVLASVGQIDANLRGVIAQDLPQKAPAFFALDIQNDQLAPLKARLADLPQVTRIESAPMLRGVITRINGQPANEVAPDHWALKGDRGVTYADQPLGPLTAGSWWEPDYNGPALMSFGAEQGREMGLKLGDEITVNILGRDITARIANFREVNFGTMGINFIMALNAGALQGAPHTHIATLYAEEGEGEVMRALAQGFANVTTISVRDAITRVSDALGALAAATSWGAAATLATGFVVLIGAAAAGAPQRGFEAAILKSLGATRARILKSLALRAALLGAAAGGIAALAGSIAGWAVMRFVMDAPFVLAPGNLALVILAGLGANLAANLIFAAGPLKTRPAQRLREGA